MKQYPKREFDCAVLIPTHKESCEGGELASLHNTLRTLSGRRVFVLLPNGVSQKFYLELQASYENLTVRNLDVGFLGSIENYNAMALSASFYEAFGEYRYVLVCHLDAWIFEDDLDRWIDRDYDYIGAPLFLPESDRCANVWRLAAPIGGNGGLSLRRTSKMIQLLSDFRKRPNYLLFLRGAYFVVRNKRFDLLRIYGFIYKSIILNLQAFQKKYNVYEDVTISVLYALLDRTLHVAPPKVSAQFALEVNGEEICDTKLKFKLPFGVHGVGKHISKEYLERMIEKHNLLQKDSLRSRQNRKKSHQEPLVTVVTIIKNIVSSGRTEMFRQCVDSVRRQTYGNIEHLIVDGASDDGTLAILEEYKSIPSIRIHSSPDNGIWDAMEKGVLLSAGEFINILNSDDYFCDDNAVEIAMRSIQRAKADWFYSDAMVIRQDGTSYPFPTSLYGVFGCLGIVHQTMFARRSHIIESAVFSSKYKTRENCFMMLLLINGYKPAYCPNPLVHYREGGFSFNEYAGDELKLEQTRADFAEYLYRFAGRRWGLTMDDCREMFGWRIFSSRGLKHSISVGLKLGLWGLKIQYFGPRLLWGYIKHHRGIKNTVIAAIRR